MFGIARLVINVALDLIAGLLIFAGIVGLGFLLILWIIFMHVAVWEIVALFVGVAFVLWRLIRFFGF